MNLPNPKHIDHWNRNASRYDKVWGKENSVMSKSADKIIEILNIRSGESCLDVCCGTGILTEKLGRQVGDRGFVLGVDIAKDRLKIAKKIVFANTELVNCAAEHFEFRKKFDVITCQFGLEFCEPYQVFTKIKQTMIMSTSRIGIVVHGQYVKNAIIFNSVARKLLNEPSFGSLPSKLMRFNTQSKLKQYMMRNELEVVSISEHSFSRYYSSFDEYVDNCMNRIKEENPEKFNKLFLVKSHLESELREKVQEFKIGDGFEFPHHVIFGVAKIPEYKFHTYSNHLPKNHQTQITEFV